MKKVIIIIDKNLDFEQEFLEFPFFIKVGNEIIFLIKDVYYILNFFHNVGNVIYEAKDAEFAQIVIGELPNIYENVPEEHQWYNKKYEDIAGGRILFTWEGYQDCERNDDYLNKKIIPLLKYLSHYGVKSDKCCFYGLSEEERAALSQMYENLTYINGVHEIEVLNKNDIQIRRLKKQDDNHPGIIIC